MLVLSWHFRAATMCEYSRDEFVSGMLRLRCDSIPKLQQRLPELRRDLQDPQKFKVRQPLFVVYQKVDGRGPWGQLHCLGGARPIVQHSCIVLLRTAWERAKQKRSVMLRQLPELQAGLQDPTEHKPA